MLAIACGGDPGSEDPFDAATPPFGDGDAGDDADDDGDGDGALDDDDGSGPSPDDGAGDGDDPGADDGGDPADGGDEPPMLYGLCHGEPPAGAQMPPAPNGYSGGTCPTITPGFNTGFQSEGRSRKFVFVIPSDYDASRTYPLVFAWHHLGSDAMSFASTLDSQPLADTTQMIFVVPEASGSFDFEWPSTPLDNGQANVDLGFFDDLLACVTQQYSINLSCVSSAGVSAGGLWTAFLGQRRGKYLASNLVFSGGYPTGPGPWWSWNESPSRFASMVVWGGPSDQLGIDFHQASLNYIDHLEDDGHFILRCEHNNGHGAPPPWPNQPDPPYLAIFEFVLEHPYWLQGSSPAFEQGTPEHMPPFCEVN